MSAHGIERVAVIGAGTMGHGIAQVCAQLGCATVLVDVVQEGVDKGLARIRGNLDKGVSLGKVELGVRDAVVARLRGTTDLEAACADADLVIEAVPEIPDLKADLLRRIASSARSDALIATNTSSLSVDDLANHVGDPSRFLGLHFFNPVHIMKLVEVVRGPRSSAEAVERGLAFARALGKQPIDVRDSPGFASSRLGVAIGLEAMRMLEEGVASPQDIDAAMELGYRHPMGPLKLTDLVGLDVRLGIARYLHETLGQEHFRPPQILERLVSEGKLGKKSGEGFYRWDEETST